MIGKVLQIFNILIYVYVMAFEDWVYGQSSQEMVENGRAQYQQLREYSSLPQYGSCWKGAIDHVDEGCRMLSEETQSDMALHLTNCFLEMSGMETYNCQDDKKPNLRAICLRNMPDRAFTVYTNFYTHTQNMCWFLRSQVWHETITENTRRVGKQLEKSVVQQNEIIESQQESLLMQEKLMHYGMSLEKVLNDAVLSAEKVFAEYRQTSKQHFELMSILTQSIGSLQSWLIGEISWFDSLVFYVSSAIICSLFTSSTRSASARFPILLLLSVNIGFERVLCIKFINEAPETDFINNQNILYYYIWYSRYCFILLSVLVLILQIYVYKDYDVINNKLLAKIHDQNQSISETLDTIKHNKIIATPGLTESVTYSRERSVSISKESNADPYFIRNNFDSFKVNNLNNINSSVEDNSFNRYGRHNSVQKSVDKVNNNMDYSFNSLETPKDLNSSRRNGGVVTGRKKLLTLFEDQTNTRYNLRSSSSRTGTPEIL